MSVVNIVGTICFPEKEERFNQWYNEEHIPALMKFKGLERVTRYKMTGAAIGPREHPMGAKDGYAKFIAIYGFEDLQAFERFEKSSELAAARKHRVVVAEEMGLQLFWRVQYESMKVWEQSGE